MSTNERLRKMHDDASAIYEELNQFPSDGLEKEADREVDLAVEEAEALASRLHNILRIQKVY